MDQGAQEIGPGGHLHVQQGIETPVSQRLTKLAYGLQASPFIEDYEFDVFYTAQQSPFRHADYPADFGAGPILLHCTDDGQNMGDIAQSRKAQYADGPGWVRERLHSVS
ncbi:MAG: hypothetical protein ACREO9_00515 [Lysobacterales bacterium]